MDLSHRLTGLDPKACMKTLQLPKFTNPSATMCCSNSSLGNSLTASQRWSTLPRADFELLSLGASCVSSP